MWPIVNIKYVRLESMWILYFVHTILDRLIKLVVPCYSFYSHTSKARVSSVTILNIYFLAIFWLIWVGENFLEHELIKASWADFLIKLSFLLGNIIFLTQIICWILDHILQTAVTSSHIKIFPPSSNDKVFHPTRLELEGYHLTFEYFLLLFQFETF